MIWSLPISVEIDGKEYAIRNKCDYRVVLDVISALNDEDLEMEYRVECALFQFYGNDELDTVEKVLSSLNDIQIAIIEMMKVINLGKEETAEEEAKPKLMDWEYDFQQIARECTCANIISIRNKKIKGKKLEKYEQEFYRENKKLVDLPHKLTDEEQEWLDSDW